MSKSVFSLIDNESKAYALGLIAGGGIISKRGVVITVSTKDTDILHDLRNRLGISIEAETKKGVTQGTISDAAILEDVAQQLGIEVPDSQAMRVALASPEANLFFPPASDELVKQLTTAFVRGIFDVSGSISDTRLDREPLCRLMVQSQSLKVHVARALGKNYLIEKNAFTWKGNAALDFLGNLYKDATIFSRSKKNSFLYWGMQVPSLKTFSKGDSFRFKKMRPDAVAPSKSNVTDSGYDLVLLEKVKEIRAPFMIGERNLEMECLIEMYDTGISIEPPYGWYFDLVPRSSITKSGYMLANSVGVIDRQYRGSILVPLVRIDEKVKGLELPNRLVQLIPRPIIHFEWEEVGNLNDTVRGEGGFGSTGK